MSLEGKKWQNRKAIHTSSSAIIFWRFVNRLFSSFFGKLPLKVSVWLIPVRLFLLLHWWCGLLPRNRSRGFSLGLFSLGLFPGCALRFKIGHLKFQFLEQVSKFINFPDISKTPPWSWPSNRNHFYSTPLIQREWTFLMKATHRFTAINNDVKASPTPVQILHAVVKQIPTPCIKSIKAGVRS